MYTVAFSHMYQDEWWMNDDWWMSQRWRWSMVKCAYVPQKTRTAAFLNYRTLAVSMSYICSEKKFRIWLSVDYHRYLGALTLSIRVCCAVCCSGIKDGGVGWKRLEQKLHSRISFGTWDKSAAWSGINDINVDCSSFCSEEYTTSPHNSELLMNRPTSMFPSKIHFSGGKEYMCSVFVIPALSRLKCNAYIIVKR